MIIRRLSRQTVFGHRSRGTDLFVGLALVSLLVGGLPAVAAAAAHIACGATLTADTTLDSDLDCSGTALHIGAPGITVDLGGYTVRGDGTSDARGVDNQGHDLVTIQNGTISSFEAGVWFSGGGVTDSEVTGLTLSGNVRGVFLNAGSHRNHFHHNTVVNSSVSGIALNGSEHNLIELSTFAGNSFAGVEIFAGSAHNTVLGNDVSGGGAGFYIADSDSNELVSNVIEGTAFDGISIGPGSEENLIHENDVSRSSRAGVLVQGDRNEVMANTIRNSSFSGIAVSEANDNLVAENVVAGAASNGVLVEFAERTAIERNELTDNTFSGVNLLRSADWNTISRNVMTSNGAGVLLQNGSDDNVVSHNIITDGTRDVGLTIQNSDRTTVFDNNVSRNPGRGISVFTGNDTTVARNVANGNGLDGIRVYSDSVGTLLNANSAHSNGDDGIDVENAATRVRDNVADSNSDLGIEAVVGAVDEGGNTANDNGNPLQCVNIICAPALVIADRVDVTTRWSSVEFAAPFGDPPVVVAGPASWVGRDQVTVRVRNVTSAGFEVRLTEWPYLDGNHTVETVSYLAVPAGRHTLVSGAVLEAGTSTVAANGSAVSFAADFGEKPVLLSTVSSSASGPGVVARTSVGKSGFSVRLDAQEADSSSYGGRVNWVAWSVGSDDGTSDGVGWETHKKAINNSFTRFSFDRAYVRPCVLADMNTLNGGDTANLRYRKLRVRSVRLRIDEEKSADTEVAHVAERVGLLVVECAKNPPVIVPDFEFGATLIGTPTILSGRIVDDDEAAVSVAIRHRPSGTWLQTDGSFGTKVQRFRPVQDDFGGVFTWVHQVVLPDGDFSLSVRARDGDGNESVLKPWHHFTVRA